MVSDSSANSNAHVVWGDAPTTFDIRSGVVMEIWGPTGTGRTSLALTAPGPIALIHFHEKIRGVVERYSVDKEIKTFKAGGVFRGTPAEIQAKAEELMYKTEAAFYDSLKWAKTAIIDTRDELWLLERLGEFGAPKPSKGKVERNWGPINARWNSLLNAARDQETCNVIFIGQTEDEWKDTADGFGRKTGKMVRTSNAAATQLFYKCDVNVSTSKDDQGNFYSTIIKGWGNAYTEGMTLSNEMSTFSGIMGLVTETDAREWE